MNDRIRQGIENNKGSALAFVLIISMVLMVMVGSLLAVANSGLFFTQESVESRQAYIDAKSVIEFGKIQINATINSYEATKQADKAGDGSADLFYITGTRSDPVSPMAFTFVDATGATTAQKVAALGVCILNWKTTTTVTDPTTKVSVATTEYTFDLKTQNLRRKLDFKTVFDYDVKTTPGTATPYVPPVPLVSPVMPADASGSWDDTQIKTPNNQLQCIIQGNGNTKTYNEINGILTVAANDSSLNIKDNKFDWLQGKILNLTAKNICVTASMPTNKVWDATFNMTATEELRFKKDYIQNNGNGKTNTLKAKNIIFEGDLDINDNTNFNIECDNLWVKGKVSIGTNKVNNPGLVNHIKAKNIIFMGGLEITNGSYLDIIGDNLWIKGNIDMGTHDTGMANSFKASNIMIGDKATNNSSVTIGDKSKVVWDCGNFWLYGNIATSSTGSIQEFKNINYLEAGNINLNDKSQLTVTGASGKTNNQMIVNQIIPAGSNAYNLNITNLFSFTCNGLNLNDNSTLTLQANRIIIKGYLTLSRLNAPIEITTQYFDCSGKTFIERLYGALNFNAMGSTLNMRFAGGYEQINSTVNINSGDQIIFGGNIKLTYDNPSTLTLNTKADNIYWDSNSISVGSNTQFKYTGKTATTTNLFIKTNVVKKQGSYLGVTGNKLEDLIKTPTAYTTPVWPVAPAIPGGTGGTSGDTVTIDIQQLQTEYY